MITWQDILETTTNGNATPPHRVEKTPEQWRERLTDEQFYVTRQAGSERPFSSDSCTVFTAGRYHCVCCDELLFDADEKFDSGSGWPSFTQPAGEYAIKYLIDQSHGMTRVEVQCNICDAHLGHVFPDGPPPSGLRYCINSLSLVKV